MADKEDDDELDLVDILNEDHRVSGGFMDELEELKC